MKCKKCNTINHDDHKYCSECGSPLRGWQCPNCHTIMKEEAKRCTKCSTYYKEGFSLCIKCEREISDEFKFCPHCQTENNPKLKVVGKYDEFKTTVFLFGMVVLAIGSVLLIAVLIAG